MNEEENQKKSILYFVYLRYCQNPKPFDEISKLTIEQIKIEIDNCKKLQCDSDE